MHRVFLIVVVAALVGGSLEAQQHRDRRPPPSPNQSDWALFYSTHHAHAEQSRQPVVTFPTNSRDSVNMLTKAWTGSTVGKTLYLTVQVSASTSTIFKLEQGPEPTCKTPPSTRPYMEANGWESVPRDYTTCAGGAGRGAPLMTAGTFSMAVRSRPIAGAASKVSWRTRVTSRSAGSGGSCRR